jgi:arylsulfatase A-like enzyme
MNALSATAETDRRPNVVVILTDDQGWGDLSVTGNTNLATPNIDSLARDGATLEHFYVCQVCAPTRAEFLTGRYYPRTGVSGVSRGEGRLNYDETTIADLFKAAGYATGCFGKWHNGTQPRMALSRCKCGYGLSLASLRSLARSTFRGCCISL